MKKLIFYLCLSLSFTNLSFGQVGSAELTVFNILIIFAGLFLFIPKLTSNKVASPRYYWTTFFLIILINGIFITSIKLTSFIYSIIILIEFLILYHVSFRIDNKLIQKINKAIILCYFVNLMITATLVAIGLPPKGFLAQIFQFHDFVGEVRPQGFSSEPSYAAIICSFSLFLLMKTEDYKVKKSNVIWYIFSIISILLTKSSYGIIFLSVLLGAYLLEKKILSKRTIFIAPFVILAILFGLSQMDYSDSKSVQRLVVIYDLLAKADGSLLSKLKLLNSIDSSASFRVLPIIEMFNYYSNTNFLHILFGNGAGQASNYFRSVFELSAEESDVSLGFIPSFIYNYGIVGTSTALVFFYSLLPKDKKLAGFLLVLVLFNADLNTQIFLYVLFTFLLIKRFEKTVIDAKN